MRPGAWAVCFCGTFPRVSPGRSPDHPALRCPDFPRRPGCLSELPATARPATRILGRAAPATTDAAASRASGSAQLRAAVAADGRAAAGSWSRGIPGSRRPGRPPPPPASRRGAAPASARVHGRPARSRDPRRRGAVQDGGGHETLLQTPTTRPSTSTSRDEDRLEGLVLRLEANVVLLLEEPLDRGLVVDQGHDDLAVRGAVRCAGPRRGRPRGCPRPSSSRP